MNESVLNSVRKMKIQLQKFDSALKELPETPPYELMKEIYNRLGSEVVVIGQLIEHWLRSVPLWNWDVSLPHRDPEKL
jgi:hypothetical protein